MRKIQDDMRSSIVGMLFLFHAAIAVYAQPANNECGGAIEITDVTDWCSEAGAFSNQGATPSGFSRASCFSGESNDVWFKFTPVATDVTVTIIGAASPVSGGTLRRPEVALYSGNCNSQINQESCASDARGNHIVELYKGGMVVGATYLIRVQGAAGQTGTFQLCINNYSPPVVPGADCFDASVLCNKESFVVQQVIGGGSDPTEANDAPCLNVFGGNVESNSTWFTWTAATDGTLEFTLTPLNPSDDLDFVLYELPNGPLNCSGKIVVRCMASGSFDFPSPCMGPTGLRAGENDIAEPAGCEDPRRNNLIAPLDMEAGKSYALVVNNFSESGNGFKIDFGGTGEFQGPEAAFTTDDDDNTVCVGKEITFIDASTFDLGLITNWTWSFGEGADVATLTGQGPHTVSYSTSGLKSIVLTVESDRGCIVTEIGAILVECCSDHFSVDAAITGPLCPDDNTGSIDLSVVNDYGPYIYGWTTGSNAEDINGLNQGEYTVTISDAARCDTSVTFFVTSPDVLDVDTLIAMPTCNGGTDGAVTLPTRGGLSPYEYNWENNGFGPDNFLNDISSGDYRVIVRDANGCEIDLTIPVRELELVLDPSVEGVDPPSCAGFSDGSIEVVLSNGLGPYRYDWNDGQGFRDENSLRGIRSGVYSVDVTDANLCRGSFSFSMEDPPQLTLDFDVLNASCNGVDDGEVAALVSGGVGNYSYAWNNGQTDSVATGLPAGAYAVTILDGNGCRIEGDTAVVEPALIDISIVGIQDVVCNGEASGQIRVAGTGGNPPYEFSIDGEFFQVEDLFTGLPSGSYTLSVMDALGCNATTEATVDQPPALTVDAGEDQAINLGFDTRLVAIANAGNVTFVWSPSDSLSCTDCPNPRAFPTSSTMYTVMVTDEGNCSALDSVRIDVVKFYPVYIPSGFSPNGDGINDYFTIFGGPAVRQVLSLQVFDRWGELIYEGENLPLNVESSGWDGTFKGEKMDSGVFVYISEIQFIDGEVVTFQGDISLVR